MTQPQLRQGSILPLACEAEREADAHPFAVTIEDDVRPEHLLPGGLTVHGRRRAQRRAITPEPTPLPAAARPTLPLGTRAWVGEDGAARLSLPPMEPHAQQRNGVLTYYRRWREVVVSGELDLFWQLVRRLDGEQTAERCLDSIPPAQRPSAAWLLRALRDAEALDVSGRPIARFVHAVTRRGAAALPPLTQQELRRLALDANYRRYSGAEELPVSSAVPPALSALHAITRARRSAFGFSGAPIARDQLDGILTTACGVTAIGEFGEGECFPYRAYPSPGGLYAVEAYPVVFAVDGLASGIYHYRPVDGVLEAFRPGVDPAVVLEPALPLQRPLVEGAAVLVMLTGIFPRLEQKYGEGCYRVLAAEAGHLSEALLLTATALGLATRPLGGFVDDLLNAALGLDVATEQFLLAVAIGQPRH